MSAALVLPLRKSSRTHRLSQRALEANQPTPSINQQHNSSSSTTAIQKPDPAHGNMNSKGKVDTTSKHPISKTVHPQKQNINQNNSSSTLESQVKQSSSPIATSTTSSSKKMSSVAKGLKRAGAESKDASNNKKPKTSKTLTSTSQSSSSTTRKQYVKKQKHTTVENEEQVATEYTEDIEDNNEKEEEEEEEEETVKQEPEETKRFPTVESHLNLKKLDIEPFFSTMLNVAPNLKIDLSSEMRLQRQRRLLQLALLNNGDEDVDAEVNEIDDSDIQVSAGTEHDNHHHHDDHMDHDHDHAELFDNSILSSDEFDSDDEFVSSKRDQVSTSIVQPANNNFTMGLESVDRIISQINSMNDENMMLKDLNEDSNNLSFNNMHINQHTSLNNDSQAFNLIDTLRAKNPSNENVSEEMRWPLTPSDNDNFGYFNSTDSNNLRQQQRLRAIKRRQLAMTMNYTNTEKDENMSHLDEFLNLTQNFDDDNEEDEEDIESNLDDSPKSPASSIDIEDMSPTTPTTTSSAASSVSQAASSMASYSPVLLPFHRGPLEYRYHDHLNLALVDDDKIMPLKQVISSKGKRALKRRAIISGKAYSEMVNTGSSFGIHDFLI